VLDVVPVVVEKRIDGGALGEIEVGGAVVREH